MSSNERARPKGRISLYPSGANRFSIGTWEDLAADGIVPVEGVRLGFYDFDGNDAGEPDWLIFDGTIHLDADGKWYAKVDPGSFRHESDEKT
jgi:hypothetical protein